MFAFHALERDANGIVTDEAEVGGALAADAFASLLRIERMLTAYFTGVAEGAEQAQANAKK